MIFKFLPVFLAFFASSQAGVPIGDYPPPINVPLHNGHLPRGKTTILANSAPGTGGHAPNNLVTLLKTPDGGYVRGEEPDPPAIQRPSSTVYRSDEDGHGAVGVGPHGQLVHGAKPYQFGYINRNEHGGSYHHTEKADSGNRRTGSYGFTGADGTYRRVDYVADENGYRAKISTNEQGTSSHASADALTIAEQPPYLQYNPQGPAPAPTHPVAAPSHATAAQIKALNVPIHANVQSYGAPSYAGAAHIHAPVHSFAAPSYARAGPIHAPFQSYAAPSYASAAQIKSLNVPIYASTSPSKSIYAPSYPVSTPVLHASGGYPAPNLAATSIAASRKSLFGTLPSIHRGQVYAQPLSRTAGYAATPILTSVGYAAAPVLSQHSPAYRTEGYLGRGLHYSGLY